MRRYVIASVMGICAGQLVAQPFSDTEKIYVTGIGNQDATCFLYDNTLFSQRWDTLAQPRFWRQVMNLTPDSALINVGRTRQILERICIDDWNANSDSQKEKYRDQLRKKHGLASDERILVTSGKNHFYRIDLALPHLNRGIEIFEENCTDPWYAQTILLIESPGIAQKSNAGAHGSFQLMPDVARMVGLTVNRHRDDRLDFEKAAAGAARLIREICVPQANDLLAQHGITRFNSTELWYRLLVMHIYHAGSGNVAKALNVIRPTSGNMELIMELWQTEAAGFRNASQNYSQIALASIMELYDLVYLTCDDVCNIVPVQM